MIHQENRIGISVVGTDGSQLAQGHLRIQIARREANCHRLLQCVAVGIADGIFQNNVVGGGGLLVEADEEAIVVTGPVGIDRGRFGYDGDCLIGDRAGVNGAGEKDLQTPGWAGILLAIGGTAPRHTG